MSVDASTTYGSVVNDETDVPRRDPLEETIGNFGRWQLKVSVLMALLKIPIAWFTLSVIFLAPPSRFWCGPPPNYNASDEEWLKDSKPNEKNAWKQEGLNSGYCVMRTSNDSQDLLPCVYGYAYDRSIFRSTIITEWNLVCGHQRLIDFTQITLMFGILLGNIIFGVLADKKGRKPILMTCITLQCVFGVISSWSPWYFGFVAARFLLAVSNGGTMVTSFVMCMEVVGGKWRTAVPILYQLPFGIGNSIMAGLAYVLRDWRSFHFAMSMLTGLFVSYVWCVPESPRWLLAIGRKDEAVKILTEAARVNGKDPAKVERALKDLSSYSPRERTKVSLGSLFGTKELKKRSCLLFLNWMICGVTFYAFSQYLGNISRDIFLTVATSGLIVLPGTFLCIFLVANCGRRWTIALAHILMAFCFLAILSIPKGRYANDWPRVVLASCGLVGLSVSMPALYLYTGELYPTVLRNGGVGVSIMFSRIGSMLAPLIISMEEIGTHVPLMILAVAAFSESILILPLPETKGKDLPETVEDLEIEGKPSGYRVVMKDSAN